MWKMNAAVHESIGQLQARDEQRRGAHIEDLLAARDAGRVLWTLARQRRFDPPKTDRVTR